MLTIEHNGEVLHLYQSLILILIVRQLLSRVLTPILIPNYKIMNYSIDKFYILFQLL